MSTCESPCANTEINKALYITCLDSKNCGRRRYLLLSYSRANGRLQVRLLASYPSRLIFLAGTHLQKRCQSCMSVSETPGSQGVLSFCAWRVLICIAIRAVKPGGVRWLCCILQDESIGNSQYVRLSGS